MIKPFFINTPFQRGGAANPTTGNRFNGFPCPTKTVETVEDAPPSSDTLLKQGVNESLGISHQQGVNETYGSISPKL